MVVCCHHRLIIIYHETQSVSLIIELSIDRQAVDRYVFIVFIIIIIMQVLRSHDDTINSTSRYIHHSIAGAPLAYRAATGKKTTIHRAVSIALEL